MFAYSRRCLQARNFFRTYKCVLHDTELIKSVARQGVLFGRAESQMGRNTMLCLKIYRIYFSLTEFMSGGLSPSFCH